MAGGDVENPLPDPQAPSGIGREPSDAIPPGRKRNGALAACLLAAVVLAIVLGVILGGGRGEDKTKDAVPSVNVGGAGANTTNQGPAGDGEGETSNSIATTSPTPAGSNNAPTVATVADPTEPNSTVAADIPVTTASPTHEDNDTVTTTSDKDDATAEDNDAATTAADVDNATTATPPPKGDETEEAGDGAGAAGPQAQASSRPTAPRYLASDGPIAARVRIIDPRVADGYGSCDDLRGDIAEALKHYANKVILQEAQPWNDWYEKCDCASDEPCRYPWAYQEDGDVLYSMPAAMEFAPAAKQESTAVGAAAATGQEEPGEDSFGTNNQVEGVDEGDIVKSDGEHVFAAYGDVIYAWRARDGREGASITRMPYEELDKSECTPDDPPPIRPFEPLPVEPLLIDLTAAGVAAESPPEEEEEEEEPGSAGKRDLFGRRGRRRASYMMRPDPCYKPKPRILSLLLNGPRLTAIVSEENVSRWWHHGEADDDEDTEPILQDHGKLTIRVYDVTDVPADGGPLELLGEREIRGNYDSARSVDETGFVISTSYLNTGSFANDLHRRHPQYCGLNSTEYKELAAEVAVNNSAPFTERIIEELDMQLDGTCDGMFQLAAMQSGDSEEDRSDGVLLSQFVQVLSFNMSADFVDKEINTRAAGAFSSGWLSSVYASQNFAATLNVGSNYDSKTGDWSQATFVLGFDIGGAVPKPFCYAEIPGSPLNQYSTDLYQGHLRVVTTENNWRLQTGRTKNKIFVLEVPEGGASSSEMVKVGESGHVGKPNESVYSVRFIGPRAYIVTFERIDPFYIYDLSDPANPTKLGELEIPGFSSYLHPIEIEGVPLILGVGEHVDEESQRRAGVKISLFDISDETSPRENATFVDKGAYSTANNDFKAFRYLPLSRKLVLPKSKWSGGEGGNFDGFAVYDVRLGDVAPAHEIRHARSRDMFRGCWYDAYMPARSLVFQSKLTTILSHSVISTDLADGAQLWNMSLDEGLNNTECSPYFFGF